MKFENLRTIDLFSGAGGSSYGAQNAGANIVAAFEIWDTANKVYQANFPQTKIFAGDIKFLNRLSSFAKE